MSAIFVFAPAVQAGADARDAGGLPYAWASKRLDGEIWGMARHDVDGDGATETLLLRRESLIVGHFDGVRFDRRYACGWDGAAQAARLDLIDLDGDGREEAVVTAVEGGLPSSLALKLGGQGCEQFLSHVRLSLRVLDMPPEGDESVWTKRLVGQGWSSQQYFSGAIEEYRLEGGKLTGVRKLELPRGTRLYRFAYLPPEDGSARIALYRSAAPLEVRLHVRGKKWKKLWRSPERYGGSGNYLPAEQRPALDEVQSYDAYFELPPLVMRGPSGADILMVKYDMPLHNIIGRRPFIRSSTVFLYRPDEAFVYAEASRMQKMPGQVADYLLEREGASDELFALVQDNRGAFENPTESMVLRFDVTTAAAVAPTPAEGEKGAKE